MTLFVEARSDFEPKIQSQALHHHHVYPVGGLFQVARVRSIACGLCFGRIAREQMPRELETAAEKKALGNNPACAFDGENSLAHPKER